MSHQKAPIRRLADMSFVTDSSNSEIEGLRLIKKRQNTVNLTLGATTGKLILDLMHKT